MDLTFLGATGTVTGSKYLIESDGGRFLIDCGLFQGYKELRLRNWNPLAIPPNSIDAVILTHAHIDHSGYLPLLSKNGFNGKIYCSYATRDLCTILLRDCGYLQEEEARLANRLGYSRHKPALPLYTKEDAEQVLTQFFPVKFGIEYQLQRNLTFKLHHAGHILGSSFVLLTSYGTKLLFSGDIGRLSDPVMKPPSKIQETDYLVLESTYGDRIHQKFNTEDQLAAIINHTVHQQGMIIIPAFAVGRTQTILYFIYQLKKANKIPDVPVYLDSPMATSATEIFCEYANEHRLSKNQCIATFSPVHYVHTMEESNMLDQLKTPAIIISASGMATGGRVLQHLKTYASDPRNTILITGYQAGGTRGDRLIRGEKEIKMLGKMVSIKARVEILHNISAHADSSEIISWLKNFSNPPKKIFITHGELKASLALKSKIETELGWNCSVPEYLEKVELL